MERQDLINWLVRATAQMREWNLRPFDLDDQNDLRVIMPGEHFLLIPSHDEEGDPCTYLILVTPEARKVYAEAASGPLWPEFEDDLRDALGQLA